MAGGLFPEGFELFLAVAHALLEEPMVVIVVAELVFRGSPLLEVVLRRSHILLGAIQSTFARFHHCLRGIVKTQLVGAAHAG